MRNDTFKLSTSKAIGNLVDKVTKNLVTLDADVHEAVCQTVAHVEKHGDWTLLKRLMAGLKASGYRFQGVVAFIGAYSPVRFPADKSDPVGFTVKVLKPGDDGYKPFDVPAMWSTDWRALNITEERVGKAVYADDITKNIMAAQGRFLKLVENTNPDGTPRDDTKPYYRGDVGAMLSFLNQIAAIKAPEDRAKIKDAKRAEREAEEAMLKIEEAPAPVAVTRTTRRAKAA